MATLATATEKKAHLGVDEKSERKPQRARVDDKFKIFCGTANEPLADEVCAFLGLTRGQAMITRFRDGEAYVQIQENVRGADVFVVQSMCSPVDHHIIELFLMIDALRRASAARVTAVVPYFAYAKQEKKMAGREPISAKVIAKLIETVGADRVLTVDLHAPAIEGFFDIPVDHLRAAPLLSSAFQKIRQVDHVATTSDWGNSRLAAQPATAESTPAIENATMGIAKLPV